MKKYLIVLLVLFCIVSLSCKKKKEDDEIVKELDKIVATHLDGFSETMVVPYFTITSLPNSNFNSINDINYTIRYTTNFLKPSNVTERFYESYQIDYYFNNDYSETFHHTYNDSDRDQRKFSDEILNHISFNNLLKHILCSVNYNYKLDGNKVNTSYKFFEDILEFNESNFNDAISSEYIYIERNSNSFKLNFNFIDSKDNGHFDIQTWIKCDDIIIPFIGYYNYYYVNGNISQVRDTIIDNKFNISEIYYQINYYDSNGNLSSSYYKENL